MSAATKKKTARARRKTASNSFEVEAEASDRVSELACTFGVSRAVILDAILGTFLELADDDRTLALFTEFRGNEVESEREELRPETRTQLEKLKPFTAGIVDLGRLVSVAIYCVDEEQVMARLVRTCS